eukprot:2588117-Ditylum_brightwellii.AAC.1
MAWRLELPPWVFGIFSTKFLEYLPNVITHWLSAPNSHFKHAELSRRNAKTDMSKNLVGYSQHICGAHNDIRDMLSRDFHLSEDQLIFLLLSLFPKKMMHSF